MKSTFHPEEYSLSNGIPVIFHQYPGSVAATYWWVGVGSADEAPEEAGFAHFLEHMLFKDAAAKEFGRASTGKVASAIESFGGEINAYTSFDQTVYHVTCAAQHWERVLGTFGTMAEPGGFLLSDFDREREVILEELRKNEDSPGRQLFQNLFSTTFRKHPYGRPVIGFRNVLKKAKLGQLESFYKRNYISGKMGLILVGPLEGARKKGILKILEKHYGSGVIPKKAGVKVERKIESPLRDDSKWNVKAFDVKSPSLSFSFRVPNLQHEDVAALDLMSSIVGVGELSRLYRQLFYERALVTDVSGGLFIPKDPGMFYVQADVDSTDKVAPAAKEIFNALRKMAVEGPTSEELTRVLINAESEKLYSTQTVDSVAGRIGFLKFIIGDLDYDRKYLEELKAVTAEKIKEVANKYFDYRRMGGVVLVPKTESHFNASEIESVAREAFRVPEKNKEKVPRPNKNLQPEGLPQLFTMPSGLKCCVNYRSQSPLFSIHASVLGGLRLEITDPIGSADADWGSSHLLASTWTKGTSTLDAHKILALTEGNAASLDGFSGRNSAGIQMTGLARDWEKLSNLFIDVLLNPVFPENELDHARRVVAESIKSVDDHSSQLCSKLFLETLFQSHPYGRMVHGSSESIQAIDRQKLSAYHRRWVRPERLVISVSGAVDPQQMQEWLSKLNEQAAKLAENSSASKIQDEPNLKAPRWVEKFLNREQAHILVGGLGTRINSNDRHAVRLLQNILGGQSGRLFIELREKRSLAYTVAPVNFEGLERGYMGVYIACAPEKRGDAIMGIRKVLERLANDGPTAKEMKRTKEFYLGRRAMDLQSDSDLASHFGLETLYGLPYFTDQQILKKIEAVTPAHIKSACLKYLCEPPLVTSAVG